ncbi:hypothetical protein PIROE2DRAFT_10125, partial [Piromyces sp. E2]
KQQPQQQQQQQSNTNSSINHGDNNNNNNNTNTNNNNRTFSLNQNIKSLSQSSSSVFSSSIEDFENKILSKTIPSLFKQTSQDLKLLRKKIQDPSSSSNTNDKQSKTVETTSVSRVSQILDKPFVMMDNSTTVSRVSQFFDKKYQSAIDNISQCINNAKGNSHSELDYTSYQSQSFLSSQEDHGEQGDSITSYSMNMNMNMNIKNDYNTSFSSGTITQRKIMNKGMYNNSSFTESNRSRLEDDPILDINISPNIPRDYSQIIDFGSELNFIPEEQSNTTSDIQSNNVNYHGQRNTRIFSDNDNFSNSIKSLINEIDRLKTNFNNYRSIDNGSSRITGGKKNKSYSLNRNEKESDDVSLQDVLYLDSLYDDIVTRSNTITNQSQSYASEYLHHQYHMQDDPQNRSSNYSLPPPPFPMNKDISTADSEIRRIYNELNSNPVSSKRTHKTKSNRNNNNNSNNNNDYSNFNSVQEMDDEFQKKRNFGKSDSNSESSKVRRKISRNNSKSTLTSRSNHGKRTQSNHESKILKFNSKVQMNEINQNQSINQNYHINLNQSIGSSSNNPQRYTTQQQKNVMIRENSTDSNSLLIKYDDSVTNDTEEENHQSHQDEEDDVINESLINTNILLNTHINTDATSIPDLGIYEEEVKEEEEEEEVEEDNPYYSFENSPLKNEKLEGINHQLVMFI